MGRRSTMPAPYEIKDGEIVTTLWELMNVMVYKVGDKYMAARSNEFGYRDCKVEPRNDGLHTWKKQFSYCLLRVLQIKKKKRPLTFKSRFSVQLTTPNPPVPRF